MRYLKILLLTIFVLLGSLVIYVGIFPKTEAFDSSQGIAQLKEVEIGGMKQWISVRGEDVSNPVLLWLHGGPGLAQMPLAHYLDGALEEEFVVVHWDQRGAGKSNTFDFDESTMTEEQFLSDAYELVQYLKKSLEKEKIYLVGHSWGSKLGIELAKMHPEEFHAYISVTQIVDIDQGLDISYNWLREELIKNRDYANLARLKLIGQPPFKLEQYQAFALILIEYGGNVDMSREKLVAIAVQSPEYTFFDYIQWLDGAFRNGKPMWSRSDEYGVNIREEIPSLDLPVYFFAGRHDYTTPLVLIEEYFEIVDAPKKELIIFEESAHTPFLKEKEKFYSEIIRIKGEETK